MEKRRMVVRVTLNLLLMIACIFLAVWTDSTAFKFLDSGLAATFAMLAMYEIDQWRENK